MLVVVVVVVDVEVPVVVVVGVVVVWVVVGMALTNTFASHRTRVSKFDILTYFPSFGPPVHM